MAQAKQTHNTPRRKRTVLAEATWRRHISQYKASNLSQTAYCNKHDMPVGTFSKWKAKLDGSDGSEQFIPVKLPSPQTVYLEMIIQGDIVLKIPSDSDPSVILPWVNALRQLS